MREFILKDFQLHKRYIIALGTLYPFYIGFVSSRINSPRLFALLSAFMYVIVALILFTREDKFKAVGLALSLPSTRRRIILGRYVTGWLLMIGCWILGTAVSLLWPGPGLKAADLVGMGAVLLIMAYMTAAVAVFQPMTVQFGLAGILVFLVGTQILGVLAMMFRASVQTIKAVIGSVGRGVDAARAAFGPAGGAAAVLLVLFLVNYLSFELSVALFKRKEF
jgi:hypothetical protein